MDIIETVLFIIIMILGLGFIGLLDKGDTGRNKLTPLVLIIALIVAFLLYGKAISTYDSRKDAKLSKISYTDIVNLDNSKPLYEIGELLEDKYTNNELNNEIFKNKEALLLIEGNVQDVVDNKIIVSTETAASPYYVIVTIDGEDGLNIDSVNRGDKVKLVCAGNKVINRSNYFPIELAYVSGEVLNENVMAVENYEAGGDNDSYVDVENINKHNEAIVKIVDIKKSLKDEGLYIDVEITNNTDVAIKNVEGVLDMKDMFQDDYYKQDIGFNNKVVEPSEAVIYKDVKVGSLLENESNLSNDDFSFNFIIKKIIFIDGAVLEY